MERLVGRRAREMEDGVANSRAAAGVLKVFMAMLRDEARVMVVGGYEGRVGDLS